VKITFQSKIFCQRDPRRGDRQIKAENSKRHGEPSETKLQSKLKVARLSGVETSHNLIEPAIKSIEASNRPSGLKATLDAYQETPICNINSGPAARGPDASAVFALGSLR
jgi:hypothetical protein